MLDKLDEMMWLKILGGYKEELDRVWFGDDVVDVEEEKEKRIKIIRERLETRVRDRVMREMETRVKGMSVHFKLGEVAGTVSTACGKKEFKFDIKAKKNRKLVTCGSCKRSKKFKLKIEQQRQIEE